MDAAHTWKGPLWFPGLGLLAGLSLIFVLIFQAPAYLPIVPLSLAGILALTFAAKRGYSILYIILSGFVLIVGFKEGFQLEEFVYAVLYLSYLGYWFISRLFFYRDPVLQGSVEASLFLFLCYMTLSIGLLPVFHCKLDDFVGGWQALSMLAFFFPVREACLRDHHATRILWMILCFIALYIAIRNLLEYRTELSSAAHLWQIASGRVTENEHVLMLGGLGGLVLLLYASRWHHRFPLAMLVLIFTAGVVIGQSRALWLSYLLGIAVLFFFTDRLRRLRLVFFLLASGVFLVGILTIFFSDFFTLIIAGLIDRFATLETATSKDISLLTRFSEMQAVWGEVIKNPIIGYGFGVPYRYFSLVYETTYEPTFIHNGYLSVLYRHGLIGFFLLFTPYIVSMYRSVQLFRFGYAPQYARLVGLVGIAFLVAEALVGNSENPFANSDKPFIIGILWGMVAGNWERYRAPFRDAEARPGTRQMISHKPNL